MSKTDPIYVDASLPADLRVRLAHPVHTACPTLQEAVIAFHKLSAEHQAVASVTMRDGSGRVYHPADINRLHYGPRP